MQGPLQPDVWQLLISRHLFPHNLCALMACSKDCFFLWSADRAWLAQWNRVCSAWPAVNDLYAYNAEERTNSHAMKRNDPNKKHKTAWLMPSQGLWWLFKNRLVLGCNIQGYKRLCKLAARNEALVGLVAAVARARVPYGAEKLVEWKLEAYGKEHTTMFVLHCWTPGKSRMEFKVKRGEDDVGCLFWNNATQAIVPSWDIVNYWSYYSGWFFVTWTRLVFGTDSKDAYAQWQHSFGQLMCEIE